MSFRQIAGCATALVFSTAGANVSAQGIRAELTTSGRDVWHGLTRWAGATATGTVAFTVPLGIVAVTAGADQRSQWDAINGHDSSQVNGFSSRDLWLQSVVNAGEIRFTAGLQVHRTETVGPVESTGPLSNTNSLYLGMGAPFSKFDPQVELWFDANSTHGVFLRLSEDMPILAWPFAPFVVGSLDSELGINLSQDLLGPTRRIEIGSHDGGITYVGTGLTLSIRNPDARLTGALGFRTQLNFNDATRFSDPGRSRDVIAWFWAGASYTLRNRRSVR
jgi:hypothetical protein